MDIGRRILLTAVVLAGAIAVRYGVAGVTRLVSGKHKNARAVFWARQIASLLALAIAIVGVLSIWVLGASGGAVPVGLVTAGLAVALQKVWTAFAGYLVLMRGRVYTVGDRIAIGSVKGDVLSVGFLYTRIMEMGESGPPDKREVWVSGRQFTGRIVTITNDRVFNDPIFNYTREFPFLYEEIVIPIKYDADRKRAEEILLRCAEPATAELRELSEESRRRLEEEYFVTVDALTPRVYYRLTDNWLELTLRFVVRDHGIRSMKDSMSRHILDELDAAGIGIASATFEIVGLPPLRSVESLPRTTPNGARREGVERHS
jgi:small-conductance mechanosensitive channel